MPVATATTTASSLPSPSFSRLKLVLAVVVFFVICFITFALISSLSKYSAPSIDEGEVFPTALSSEYLPQQTHELGIAERHFLLGTAGFIPANFPEYSAIDVQEYWQDVYGCCEIYGVHVEWTDTDLLQLADENLDMDIALVLGFQTPDEWRNSRDEYLLLAKKLLADYPQIKYLAIGNEMNIEYEKDPQAFADFWLSYHYLYQELHAARPELMISTVFQYEALLGEGYLTGQSESRTAQLFLLAKLEGYADFVALTSYPFLDYTDPGALPSDYYTQLKAYTDLPLAFTETGWISQTEFSGQAAALNGTEYTSSEAEQYQWLLRFLELTQDYDMEYANWVFLNDINDWQNNEQTSDLTLFDSVGLHYNNGTAKQVWDSWLSLKQLPLRD